MSDKASKLKTVSEQELLIAILVKLCGDADSANSHLQQVLSDLYPKKELPAFSIPVLSK